MVLRSTLVLLFIILVPSPVQNLTATSNATHIITMWVAPASPNGLVNYTIEIQEINLLTHEITMFETMTVSEEALILERQVRPYLMYNVSVTSQTSAGAGETVMTSFTTPEAGENDVICALIKARNACMHRTCTGMQLTYFNITRFV